ncbi:hypothetical protein [Aidingimonas lacisalsi]|uniref:hypothetical protein n=1 Tax=Aidingimonas lacisalsi TaxID=2604086 RepID=UPI0011D18FEA|nr:hypothetical protein [Aidingimonas lacisalsi]
MYWSVQRARLQTAIRSVFQAITLPLEKLLLWAWEHLLPGSRWIEKAGLPRRAVEQRLGTDLLIHVDPRQLIRGKGWQGVPAQCRPSSSAFIWDGDWDLRRGDLRHGSRYRLISDLASHRKNLRESEQYKVLKLRLDDGVPFASHQQGILLDSEERILNYLQVYLSFLDDMAVRGFDSARGKDWLGVAVSREGRLLKINRGLHRLAMAQWLGLPSVPVRVMAVHHEWWQQVVGNAKGHEAWQRLARALSHCKAETRPGELDPIAWPDDFEWPASS